MRRNDEIYIHNAERPWAIWDHYPFFARIEEETHRKVFQNRNDKWTGWKPTTEDQLMKFKKEVMKKKAVWKKISKLYRKHRKCGEESSAPNESTKRRGHNEHSGKCKVA